MRYFALPKTERRAPQRPSCPSGRNQRIWCLFLCSPRVWLNFAWSRTRWAPQTIRSSAARARACRSGVLKTYKITSARALRESAAFKDGFCFQKASGKLPGKSGTLPTNLPARPWHIFFRRVPHSALIRTCFFDFVQETSGDLPRNLPGSFLGASRAAVISASIQFWGLLLFWESVQELPGTR